MNLIDPELQDKIDKVDAIRTAIGGNIFAALTQATQIEELFPVGTNGNERTGEQNTQGQSTIQKDQTGPDPETGSTDTAHE